MSKSVEELFKDAPDGTTHWDKGISRTHGFMKLENGFWFYWPSWSTDPDWDELCDFGGVDMADMIPRPQPKPWSGPEDGLPPVNKQVMFKVKGLHQGYGFVSFYGQEFCVIRNTTQDGGPTEQVCKISEFTVVTPEQLAAEKRETAIREFMDVVGIDCRVTASKAVDAGFKREVV